MITTLLATGLLLSVAPVQESERVPAQVGLTDVTAAQERIPRIHAVPSRVDPAKRAELEAALADPSTPGVVRATAHVEYLAMLEYGTSVARADELAEAVSALLAPEFEEGGPDIRSTYDGHGLLVAGTEAEHAVIADMLRDLENERRLVHMKASIYRLPRAELDRITAGRSARAIDEAERASLLTSLESYDRLLAPAVVARPGSKATMTAGEQVAYIADFEVKTLPDQDSEIADPVVETVFDGLRLEFRAAPFQGAMRLDVRFESSELQRPIPTQELQVGAGGAKVTIQRPVVTAIETSALFDLAEDGTVALRAVDATGESGEGALILLRARLVEPANGGVRFKGR